MSTLDTSKAPVALTYGPFTCTGEHAVEVAYLMSCAEEAIDRLDDVHEVGFILTEYARGNLSIEDAIAELSPSPTEKVEG